MKSNLLTETELELMNILWRLGEGSVSDVIAQLGADRQLAYTSVSTILRILAQKKIVAAKKAGRGHIYVPTLAKEEYETRTLKHVVENVFDGTAIGMVKQLLNSVNLTENEIDELKKMVAAMDAGKFGGGKSGRGGK